MIFYKNNSLQRINMKIIDGILMIITKQKSKKMENKSFNAN